MELPNKEKLQIIYKKLTAFDEDRKSYMDIFGGFIFSFFISIIPAAIYVVLLVSKDENISLSFVWHRFVISLIISTIIVYLIRFFVKGFAKKFSIIFFSFLFILFIILIVKNIILGSVCLSKGGKWVPENPSFPHYRLGSLSNKCVK